ncbi:hypothetical protein ACMS1Z_14245 [Acidiphilium multivorum]|uniref:hypothetical protein n=1 Tax=Acidiphilium multivorum TaxID=62140 RepID=UPI0039C99761
MSDLILAHPMPWAVPPQQISMKIPGQISAQINTPSGARGKFSATRAGFYAIVNLSWNPSTCGVDCPQPKKYESGV